MPAPTIHTIDLSSFFVDGDESGRKKAKETIAEACTELGLFEIVNHGVPIDLMDKLMELTKEFFSYSDEVKSESIVQGPDTSLLPGYFRQSEKSFDRNEYILMYPPHVTFNGVPNNPPDYRKTFEEVFKYCTKTCQILEEIISECLGLPPTLLKEYNNDRSWDFLTANRYPPATENENSGIAEHEDGNLITMVYQVDAGGLEVLKDGEWIPIIPSKDKLVVNLSNVIQVLCNKTFKSATNRVQWRSQDFGSGWAKKFSIEGWWVWVGHGQPHHQYASAPNRVVRPKETSRHSIGFFYNLHGDKWVEPFPKFTIDIGVKPKYKGFVYKDYSAKRIENEINPPSGPEDMIRITHYET